MQAEILNKRGIKMTIFEKRDAYRKRIEKLYAELPEIEKRFFDETELAQAALRGGEAQEFFEHSRNAATADKQRKEIKSLPANGSGVSADEVEKAWNEYKSKNRHEKALKRLFDARKAYMDAIVEFKQVTGNEKKLVSEFREIAGVSGVARRLSEK